MSSAPAIRRSSLTADGLSLDTSAVISRDPSRTGISDELGGESGADAAVVIVVGNREGDLGGVAVAREARDRDGVRITVDVGHERISVRVDRRELPQLRLAEARLRAVEARTARPFAQTVEQTHDGANVPVAQRPYEQRRAALRFDNSSVHALLGQRQVPCRIPFWSFSRARRSSIVSACAALLSGR